MESCRHAEERNQPVHDIIIDDDWLEDTLAAAGTESTTIGRRNILEGLETRGLTQSVGGSRLQQQVITPMVYRYLKRTEPNLAGFAEKLRREMVREGTEWGLARAP